MKLFGLFIWCSIIILCSCNQHSNDPIEKAKNINESNLDKNTKEYAKLIVEAYSNNLYQIKISEDAESLSTSLEIQNLGTELSVALTILNNKIKEIATKKNIILPDALTDKQIKDSETLEEKVGYDFNVAYATEVYEKQKEAVAAFEKIISNTTDPEIKTWAGSALLEIHKHLSAATISYEHIKKSK
jgi:putative membrane protein